MIIKWIGAGFILAGCGGFGFSLAACYRREESMLYQMQNALHYMENELRFRLTPLPELCRMTSKSVQGRIRQVFAGIAEELESQLHPDAVICMQVVLARNSDLPRSIRRLLKQMGRSLGCFDLMGQLQGLEASEKMCTEEIKKMKDNRQERVRGYRTLGLCAGAALAILLF